MTSRVEELYTQTRNHPVCRHLVPLESTLSFPVPSLRGERVYLRFLFYQRGRAARGEPRPIYRPHARLSVEFPSGRLAEYSDLGFTDGASATSTSVVVGEGANPAIAALAFAEVVARRSALFSALEAIIPLLGREPLTAEEIAQIVAYRELWESLAEPGLAPAYRALDPAFFDWLYGAG